MKYVVHSLYVNIFVRQMYHLYKSTFTLSQKPRSSIQSVHITLSQ